MQTTRPIRVTESLARRLRENVALTQGGCLEWQGYRNHCGYGSAAVTHSQSVLVHRAAWTLANGPIPDGMVVCHTCDNPPCINPDHLFLGTPGDNAADRDAKGRLRGPARDNLEKTHCPQGHPYTPENTSYYRHYRMCKTCKAAQSRAGHDRSKAQREAAQRGEFIPATPELREVAAIAREALEANMSPYTAVANRLGIPDHGADYRIRRAKMAGLLPMTIRGRNFQEAA